MGSKKLSVFQNKIVGGRPHFYNNSLINFYFSIIFLYLVQSNKQGFNIKKTGDGEAHDFFVINHNYIVNKEHTTYATYY